MEAEAQIMRFLREYWGNHSDETANIFGAANDISNLIKE